MPASVAQPEQTRTVQTQAIQDYFAVAKPDPLKFVTVVVEESIKLGASDVLFEPGKDELRVRTRIDGVLYEFGKISLEVYDQIISRIKVLANLDPTERRKIQEGQFTIDFEDRTVNLRVEIANIIFGELIVIRIHEKKTIVMELSQLGFSKSSYQNYQDMLSQKSGLILVCGPTGCGKTTTLYSTISKLNEAQNYNVMTIEDPVEFQLEGVNQMQVQEDVKFTFAHGFQTILRLSPDIVLVGEIRDQETARIAVQSGLTGLLVLSTLHAADSIGALFRILDLGIEPYLLNSSLMGIVAQRLVRRTCPQCREAYEPTQDEIDLFNKIVGRAPKQLLKGSGCENCANLNYKGRTGIFEVLAMTAKVRGLIRGKANEDTIRQRLMKEGYVALLRDGLEKAEQGLTTVDEVLRNSLRIA